MHGVINRKQNIIGKFINFTGDYENCHHQRHTFQPGSALEASALRVSVPRVNRVQPGTCAGDPGAGGHRPRSV